MINRWVACMLLEYHIKQQPYLLVPLIKQYMNLLLADILKVYELIFINFCSKELEYSWRQSSLFDGTISLENQRGLRRECLSKRLNYVSECPIDSRIFNINWTPSVGYIYKYTDKGKWHAYSSKLRCFFEKCQN